MVPLGDVAHLSGGSWRVVSSDTAAAAWFVTAPNHFELASSGQVIVHHVDSNYTIDGAVDLRFPSGRVAGAFQAEWISRAVFCG